MQQRRILWKYQIQFYGKGCGIDDVQLGFIVIIINEYLSLDLVYIVIVFLTSLITSKTTRTVESPWKHI